VGVHIAESPISKLHFGGLATDPVRWRRKNTNQSTKVLELTSSKAAALIPNLRHGNSCEILEILCMCPYQCTFADPRQMEYMCSLVDCVCFPLQNVQGQISPGLGSTSGHGAELIP
jgi:hypothetical protein